MTPYRLTAGDHPPMRQRIRRVGIGVMLKHHLNWRADDHLLVGIAQQLADPPHLTSLR